MTGGDPLLKLITLTLSVLLALPTYAGKTQQKINAIREKAEADIKAATQGKPGEKSSISGDYSAGGASAGGSSDTPAVARKKDRKKKAKKLSALGRKKNSSEFRSPASAVPSTESMPQTTGVR